MHRPPPRPGHHGKLGNGEGGEGVATPVKTATDDELMPFTDTDWNFDSVPDVEIIACCLWEFARESESFLTATNSTSRREGKLFHWERTPAAMAAIDRVLDLPSDHR